MPNPDAATRESLLFQTLQRLLEIQATEVTPALNEASTLIAEVLHADKVDSFLFDSVRSSLVAVGTSDTDLSRLELALGLDRLPIANGGRTVEVFQTGTPYLNGRVDEDMGVLLGIREALGVRSMLIVPLNVQGERRGVLNICSVQPDTYTQDDLRFAEASARWVALVMHRAELVEQIARATAEQTRRAVAGELIAALAHDLQNLLTPLVWRVDLIRRRAQRESQTAYLQDADAALGAIRRLRSLINYLLDDVRLEQGIFALNLTPANVAALVRETVELMRASTIEIHLQGQEQLDAMVDEERLRQALENLLSNASKNSPDGAAVTVSVNTEQREDGTWAVIAVRDVGPGIAPALLPHIFNRFFKDASSKGLGLGLYLTRAIAEAHGGTLQVDSTEGIGTHFALAFPITEV